jgi:hypothetical protein
MSRSTSDSILSVYSDARAEYTKQLCIFLVPAYFQFFTELLQKAKDATIQEPKKILWQFQNYLNEIHDWNIEKVNNEIHTIHTNSGCDYLEELLTAVFIAHTKVLTAIRISANNKKIEINIPKVEHFLFKVLCETSKLLWSSTYLFRDGISGIEKQQNYRQVEQLINEGILQAVRSLIPVKSILKDFVNADNTSLIDDNGVESDDEIEQSTSTTTEHTTEHGAEYKKENNDAKNTDKTTHEEPVISDINKLDIPSEPVLLSESTPTPTLASQPASESAPLTTPVPELKESTADGELKVPSVISQTPTTIIIDDKPTVRFGEFNAVFDSDHPHESEMVYDSTEDTDIDGIPALNILDEAGESLEDGIDFDTLDGNLEEATAVDDYEELS